MLKSKKLTFDDIEFGTYAEKEKCSPAQSMQGCDESTIKDFCASVKELKKNGVWGWCSVKVTGVFKHDVKLNDVEYLGCCSYNNEQAFIDGDYYNEMRNAILGSIQKMFDVRIEKMNSFIESGFVSVSYTL